MIPASVSRVRVVVLVVVAVVVMAVPAAAFAAPVSLEGTPLEVQIWPGGELGYTLVIVTGHVPEDAPLPATVRLPLFDRADVIWTGEILGGPVADDPPRESAVVETPGGSALEMTAETTRTVQYEAIGPPLSVIDGMTTSVFEWVQTVPTGDVIFSVRVPASAEVVQIDPMPVGSPRVNEAGERLYTLRPAVLPDGQTYTVTVAFGREGAGAPPGPGTPVLAALLVVLLFAVMALVAAVVRQRRHSA